MPESYPVSRRRALLVGVSAFVLGVGVTLAATWARETPEGAPVRPEAALSATEEQAIIRPVPPSASPFPHTFADLAERLIPAVVNISTTQKVPGRRAMMPGIPPDMLPPGAPEEFREFFEQFMSPRGADRQAPVREATSLGSGFIIDPSGLVVTNNHVIERADEITVILHNDTELRAEVVGRDPKTDLALLRVKPDRPLPTVTFGDSDQARVGDWVLAIGNPFGLGGTVTAGIISARARNINAGPFDDFIQTDAAINRGNSGGPLFNSRGEVIGINTAIFSPTGGNIGIGFAVPTALIRPILAQLQEHGHPRRGWLGVQIQEVTPEIAESLGMREARGALVVDVVPDSPAARAGVQAGDIITAFAGQPVSAMRRLPRIVAETAIGDSAALTLWRKGQERTVQVRVGELEEGSERATARGDTTAPTPQAADGEPVLGMRLQPLTTDLRRRLRLPEGLAGVVITGVDADSGAYRRGIRPGDILTHLNEEPVRSPEDVRTRLESARAQKRQSVLIRLQREGMTVFMAIPAGE